VELYQSIRNALSKEGLSIRATATEFKSSLQWGILYTWEHIRALQRGCDVLDDIPKNSL